MPGPSRAARPSPPEGAGSVETTGIPRRLSLVVSCFLGRARKSWAKWTGAQPRIATAAVTPRWSLPAVCTVAKLVAARLRMTYGLMSDSGLPTISRMCFVRSIFRTELPPPTL